MGLVYKKQLDNKTSFGIWKIEEQSDDLLNQLQLKQHETDFIATLNEGKRHLHWLSTRVLLRKMLNDPEYIDCQIDDHGKPFLVNFPHHISMSHSFDYAAVMISEDKEVGIDIEQVRSKIERIANKFMKASELEFISSEKRTEHLYVCWCAKEAIYKLQGKNNVSFKDHIHLNKFEYEDFGVFHGSLKTPEVCRLFEVGYEKFEDYMIGYCAAEKYEK